MEIRDLYQFILLIILVGMVLGVGVLTLNAFGTSGGIGAVASGAVNSTRDALTPIASTWLPLIVTVAVLSIILALVVGSFAGARR